MESLIKKIKFYFVMRKANKELTDAILEAERMFRTNNTRYFVIPDYKHKLRVFSWGQLQKMKNQGLFSANCKESDFIREFKPAFFQFVHFYSLIVIIWYFKN